MEGTEKAVDPDWVEGGWVWPVVQAGTGPGGTGGSMLPHLAVFGRSLLGEWVQGKLGERGEKARALRDGGWGIGYTLVEGWKKGPA